MILGISFEMSVELRDDIGKVKLIDKIELWDVFFVVFGCVIDSWGRGRWRADLFNKGHGGLRLLVLGIPCCAS